MYLHPRFSPRISVFKYLNQARLLPRDEHAAALPTVVHQLLHPLGTHWPRRDAWRVTVVPRAGGEHSDERGAGGAGPGCHVHRPAGAAGGRRLLRRGCHRAGAPAKGAIAAIILQPSLL